MSVGEDQIEVKHFEEVEHDLKDESYFNQAPKSSEVDGYSVFKELEE